MVDVCHVSFVRDRKTSVTTGWAVRGQIGIREDWRTGSPRAGMGGQVQEQEGGENRDENSNVRHLGMDLQLN